jgi:hypothetical protein
MKNIYFYATEYGHNFLNYPEPASAHLPDYYKNASRFMDNEKKPEINPIDLNKNTTYKACLPFRDAMTFGYVLTLPIDLQVKKINGEIIINWGSLNELVDKHSEKQMPGFISVGKQGSLDIFKINTEFVIKTPKGYSTFFTHPLNRHDLPFRTFSGVVDTDLYEIPVNFPMQIIKNLDENDSFLIEKNTPIVQFFAVKREPWFSKKEKIKDELLIHKFTSVIKGTVKNAYGRMIWQKKIFK